MPRNTFIEGCPSYSGEYPTQAETELGLEKKKVQVFVAAFKARHIPHICGSGPPCNHFSDLATRIQNARNYQ